MTYIPEPFGPEYPDLGASVAKFRTKAKRGLSALAKEDRNAYADAVEKAIKSKQRTEFMRALPPGRTPNCASGTYANTGEAIDAAIKAQQRNRLQAAVREERRARSEHEWQKLYAEAMAKKRKQ